MPYHIVKRPSGGWWLRMVVSPSWRGKRVQATLGGGTEIVGTVVDEWVQEPTGKVVLLIDVDASCPDYGGCWKLQYEIHCTELQDSSPR